MRKTGLFCLCFLVAFLCYSQQETAVTRKESQPSLEYIRKSYAYRAEKLVLTETDIEGAYFISPKLELDLEIVGSTVMEDQKTEYTIFDKMFINRGSAAGIQEGDLFQIIGGGHAIDTAYTHGTLGRLYIPKGVAKITCLYEDRAIAEVIKAYAGINLGDFLIPYQAQNTILQRMVDYKQCRIPEKSEAHGTVVHIQLYENAPKVLAGLSDYVTVDLGKGLLSRGDFVLFYKQIKTSLPDVILGIGIVVTPQNNNATVKILEASSQVELGDKAVLLSGYRETTDTKTAPEVQGEQLPIIKTIKEDAPVEGREETFELDLFYDMDETQFDPKYGSQLARIKEFIDQKDQYLVILKGFACSIGSMEHNLKLSQDRVNHIRSYLVDQLGVNEAKIETDFYGEQNPQFDNTNEQERRKNRRVNIQVIGR